MSPDGLRHLLSRIRWDTKEVRDDLRAYVVEAFGDPGGMLIVNETGDVEGRSPFSVISPRSARWDGYTANAYGSRDTGAGGDTGRNGHRAQG